MAELAVRLIARLPLALAHLLGWPLGLLFFALPNRHRRISRINIDLCFAEKGWLWRRRLLLMSLVETGKTALESPRLWLADREELLGLVDDVVGAPCVEEALESGNGVIIIGPHLGSWEMVSLYCSAHYPMTSLYRPLRQGSLEALVVAGRKRLGAKLVPTDARGVRELSRALKGNELIGVPPDQDPREAGGTFAPFFAIAANTMTLASRLALKSGARPILCVAERLPWGRGFRIHFEPIALGGDEDIDGHVAAINRSVEAAIRRLPAQYQWSYKRFRTRPAGEAPFY